MGEVSFTHATPGCVRGQASDHVVIIDKTAAFPHLQGVEIDPIVMYLLGGVCAFAFVPPFVCKARQMFCSETAQVSDEYDLEN